MAPPTNVVALASGPLAADAPDARASKRSKLEGVGVGSSGTESWNANVRGIDLPYPPHQSWWTGKEPLFGTCPGVSKDGVITSLPLPVLSSVTREGALAYFDNTWAITEVLFSGLASEEAYYRAPAHNLRHPLIFYYAHPAVLYINKLRVAGVLDKGVNEHFESIFETGVDEMSWDDLSKNEMEWPSIPEVTEYRRTVYGIVAGIIATHGDFEALPINQGSAMWALFMGFEHERIHIETSSVLYRELPIRLLRRPAQFPPPHPTALTSTTAPELNMVPVAATNVVLGKPADYPTFGWDNEYGEKDISVGAFKAGACMVPNGAFYDFVKGGGYQKRAYWSGDGWKWRTFRNAKWPSFWVPDGPQGLMQFKLRLIFDVVDMPWGLPAIVNAHEARAFCAWLTETQRASPPYRIITEAEHHAIRDPTLRPTPGEQFPDPVTRLSGAAFDAAGASNLNLAHGSEGAVDAFDVGGKFQAAMGNAWEWCEDHLSALPGFSLHHYYDDFSSPCFDGAHHVIMGGSFISTGDEASVYARFHFRPHFAQHAGFRVVQPGGRGAPVLSCMDGPGPHVGGRACCSLDPGRKRGTDGGAAEARDALAQLALLHFDLPPHCPPGAAQGSYPHRLAQLLARVRGPAGGAAGRALDIGCGVGGVSFELACAYGEVVGVDLSADFIKAANAMRSEGQLAVEAVEEGNVRSQRVLKPPAGGGERGRIVFRHMDGMCLAPDLGEFDCVVVANVLTHMAAPRSCLGRMAGVKGLLKVGGLLLVADTFDWSPAATPQGSWIGGYYGSGEGGAGRGQPVGSREALADILGGDYVLVGEEDVACGMPLSRRRVDLRVLDATVWRRIK